MGNLIIRQVRRRNEEVGFAFSLYGTGRMILGESRVYSDFTACKKGASNAVRSSLAAVTEDRTAIGYDPCKCPRFELFCDGVGHYCFRLADANGDYILRSEAYATKAAAIAGIAEVKKCAVSPRFYKADGDKWSELIGKESDGAAGEDAYDNMASLELTTDRPLYLGKSDLLDKEEKPAPAKREADLHENEETDFRVTFKMRLAQFLDFLFSSHEH